MRTDSAALNNVIFITVAGFLSVRHGDFQRYKDLVTFFNGENLKDLAVGVFSMVYRSDQKSTSLNSMLTKILEMMTRALGQSTANYYEYYHALMESMLKKTITYDFKSALNLFETMGHLAFELLTANSPHSIQFEQVITNYFKIALQNKSDLLNFYLQLMGIFTEYVSQDRLGHYMNVYESVLEAENWNAENLSLLSSYIKYISSFIKKDQNSLIKDKNKFEKIFIKLIELDRH